MIKSELWTCFKRGERAASGEAFYRVTEINVSPGGRDFSIALSLLTGEPDYWARSGVKAIIQLSRKDIHPHPKCEKPAYIRFNELPRPYTEVALTHLYLPYLSAASRFRTRDIEKRGLQIQGGFLLR